MIKFYDSAKKEKVDFIPIRGNEVKVYICGPTVYDDAHLGHARSSIAFDLLRRVLISSGYEVTFARNYTDIDDKIIKKLSQTNQTLKELTSKYINSYENDMQSLNVLDPDIKPLATLSINSMINLIEELLKKDIAYKIDDGVYFDVSKDSAYLSISNQVQSNDETQNRVELNTQKRNQSDFALWKFNTQSPSFETSFGTGRPGWHLECSSMINENLAYKDEPFQIDIHCGGADLLFPHHENEAAQTRCAYNQEIAKYWLHNGFVQINNEKMSKSLGNSFFLKDALKSYSGEVLRFYLLSTHYRANFNFNEEDLNATKKRLDKIYRLKKRVYSLKGERVQGSGFREKLLKALCDDLNISVALAIVDEFVSSANDGLDKNGKDKNLKKEVASFFLDIDQILGIGGSDAFSYFQFGIDEQTKQEIETLIEKRTQAKQQKDFQTADTIRDQLTKLNIQIMDTPNGCVWEKI